MQTAGKNKRGSGDYNMHTGREQIMTTTLGKLQHICCVTAHDSESNLAEAKPHINSQ
jgi:hypothetical protein